MERTEDLEKLAETCLATAKTIKQYLESNGHPQMSFDQNGPPSFPAATPEIQYARMALREAADRLSALVAGPEEPVTFGAYNWVEDLSAFRYIAHFKVASAVPLGTSIAYTELAAKLGLAVHQLKPMVRQLMQLHVFCEPQIGHVAHTASSKLLLNPGVAGFSAYNALDSFKIATNVVDAIEKFGHGSQETSQAALNITYKTDKQMFEYHEENADVRDRFSNMMTYVTGLYPTANIHVANGYDWASLGESTVVDVAGNMGHCSIPIAQSNPNVKVVVQDLPKVVKRAQDPATSVIPEELRDRFTFMAHNFYEPQPVQADVYFLRMIMHDYPDKYCIKILRQLVAAMEPDSKIIISDMMVPPVGVVPAVIERFMRTQDVQMMALSNARERDMEEWTELLKATDSRLKLKNVVTPQGSAMSFLEVVLNEAVNGHA